MKIKINALLVALVLILFTFSACNNSDSSKYGHFERVGDLNVGRAGHSATLLKDGRVLIAGGRTKSNIPREATMPVLELETYDPNTKLFSIVGKLNEEHNLTADTIAGLLLPDGRVMYSGTPGRHIEIYDSKTHQVILSGQGCLPRGEHTTTPLKDGTILRTGGVLPRESFNSPIVALDSAETFDPKTGQCKLVNHTMHFPRAGHHSLLLSNGKVAIIGGDFFNYHNKPNYCYYTIELYNPKTKQFSLLSKLKLHNRLGGQTILQSNNKILIFGGYAPVGMPVPPDELINLNNGSVSYFKGIGQPVSKYIFLNNHLILLFAAELFKDDGILFDLFSHRYTPLSNMRLDLLGTSKTRLYDGSILITGGSFPNYNFHKDAKLFIYNDRR